MIKLAIRLGIPGKCAAAERTTSRFTPALTREVNAIGDYWGQTGERSFWAKRTDHQKLEAARGHRDPSEEWFPDTKDMRKMAQQGQRASDTMLKVSTPVDLLASLGRIGATEPGSVSRLNIFTHGSDQGEIILEGTVISNNVTWSPADYRDGAFGDDLFENVREGRITFSLRGSKQEFSVNDVRKAFSKNAVVALYACHSGVDKGYLRKMSSLFGVPVKGFRQEVMYKLDLDKSGGVISTYGLGGLAGKEVGNFHELDRFFISSQP
jgi:hypothetical protein